MSYDNWKTRLEAAKLPTVAARRAALIAASTPKNDLLLMEATEKDEGYYRIPQTIKDPSGNGKNIVTGYTPVALFVVEGELIGVHGAIGPNGGAIMEPTEIVDRWTWMCGHPISYELYQAVAERGEPWPEISEPANETAAALVERVVERTDNLPSEVDPLTEHRELIANAIGAGKGLKATTAAEAAIAAGAANVIRERRLAVEKIAKERVDPLLRAYEAERNNWLPLVKAAKDAEGVLRTEVSTFEAAERRRVAAEQLAALERQREIEEAAQRAADRAIAAGQPEAPPMVEEVVIPKAPERVTPTYGGYKPREKPVLKFAVIENDVDVYKHFAANPDLRALLEKLATNAIRSGLTVPGATFRKGTE